MSARSSIQEAEFSVSVLGVLLTRLVKYAAYYNRSHLLFPMGIFIQLLIQMFDGYCIEETRVMKETEIPE
jgi:hypothetical protein